MAERRSRRNARRTTDGRVTRTNAVGFRETTSPQMSANNARFNNLMNINRMFGTGGTRNAGLVYEPGKGLTKGGS